MIKNSVATHTKNYFEKGSKLFAALVFLGMSFALTTSAEATHFRAGRVTWMKVADKTVEFTVTTAWRVNPHVQLFFGDGGSVTRNSSGMTQIFSGTDLNGESFAIWEFKVQHTYASDGPFTAHFSHCCRISSLINAGGDYFRVETVVDLRNGNTGSPVSSLPAILQMSQGTVNSIPLPVVDPDGDPVTCRMATLAESEIPAVAAAGGHNLSISNDCVLTWNTAGTVANQKYAAQIIIEQDTPGNETQIALDFIIEIVGGSVNQAPTCSGPSGTQILTVGQTYTTTLTGVDPDNDDLTVSALGLPAGATLTPAAGTTAASPFAVTFSWTPAAADIGVYAANIIFTDTGGLQGLCNLALSVVNPPVADAGEDQEICSGLSTTIGGSSTASGGNGGPYDISWSPGTGLSNAAAANPTAAPAMTTIYTVTVTETGTGLSATDDVVVTVLPSPTADAGSDAVIFAGGETTIGGAPTGSDGTGALSYSWLPVDGLDDPSAANPTAEIYASTTYTVTVTDENGCEATDEVTVTALSKEDVLSEQCAAVQALIDDPATPEEALDPLEEAKEALREALEFADENETKDMLDAMRDAADALEEAREEMDGTDEIAGALADCARHTATEKREEALECDPSPSGKMADDMEDGDNDLADGDVEYNDPDGGYFGDAIKDYRKAWEDYCNALERCVSPKAVFSDQYSVSSDQVLPERFALHQNYPNPFNPSTTIQFDLVEAGHVELKIFNSAGRLVRTLVSGKYAPGAHKVVWDAKDDAGFSIASGLYLYTIKSGQSFSAQRKLLLMK